MPGRCIEEFGEFSRAADERANLRRQIVRVVIDAAKLETAPRI
jgi:hypothetical protein